MTQNSDSVKVNDEEIWFRLFRYLNDRNNITVSSGKQVKKIENISEFFLFDNKNNYKLQNYNDSCVN